MQAIKTYVRQHRPFQKGRLARFWIEAEVGESHVGVVFSFSAVQGRQGFPDGTRARFLASIIQARRPILVIAEQRIRQLIGARVLAKLGECLRIPDRPAVGAIEHGHHVG